MAVWERGLQGIPTQWTDENRRSIVMYLEMGHKRSAAASKSNIAPGTFNRWFSRGETDERNRVEGQAPTDYGIFYLEVLAAEADVQEPIVTNWIDIATKDWKAAQAFLAARFPDEWAPQRDNGSNGGLISGTPKSIVELTGMLAAMVHGGDRELGESLRNLLGDGTNGIAPEWSVENLNNIIDVETVEVQQHETIS